MQVVKQVEGLIDWSRGMLYPSAPPHHAQIDVHLLQEWAPLRATLTTWFARFRLCKGGTSPLRSRSVRPLFLSHRQHPSTHSHRPSTTPQSRICGSYRPNQLRDSSSRICSTSRRIWRGAGAGHTKDASPSRSDDHRLSALFQVSHTALSRTTCMPHRCKLYLAVPCFRCDTSSLPLTVFHSLGHQQ